MTDRVILTFSRQFGSGGSNIAKRLAKELAIPFYDQELITESAKDTGIAPNMVKALEETPTNSLLYAIAAGTAYGGAVTPSALTALPMTDRVFLSQSDVIRRYADEGSCVILGRCADYILRKDPDAISVYIHRDHDERVHQVAKLYDKTEKKAAEMVKKMDKRRANYYAYYTDKRWGDAENYDICLNSGVLGEDGCVDLLKMTVDAILTRRQSRR
ncbi:MULTISPECIES: AAA family ATPase [Pseudoramibacter]|uniref:cytidylate kinase-like family protein n=1 Tax=Pseudoramibacter TaxID=113286 RepID=UPI002355964E|nr:MULTISPECIES: cytidylate kinase-like family protein [Pseudoramibacter]MBM6968388.1 cytidylate kinase-like family protein [Pseudoramibacter alactolyticus]